MTVSLNRPAPLEPAEFDSELATDVATWMRFRFATGNQRIPSLAEYSQSRLFQRLRQGKRPLALPPPVAGEYRYELIEDPHQVFDVDFRLNGEPLERINKDGVTALVVGGAYWNLLAEVRTNDEFLVSYGDWPITYTLSKFVEPLHPPGGLAEWQAELTRLEALEAEGVEDATELVMGRFPAPTRALKIRGCRLAIARIQSDPNARIDRWKLTAASTRSLLMYARATSCRLPTPQDVAELKDVENLNGDVECPVYLVRDSTGVGAILLQRIAVDDVDGIERFVTADLAAGTAEQTIQIAVMRGFDLLARCRMQGFSDVRVVEMREGRLIGRWEVPIDSVA